MKISLRFAYPIFAIAFTLSIYFILFVTAFDVACYADPSYYKKEFVKIILLLNSGDKIICYGKKIYMYTEKEQEFSDL